MGWLYTEFLTIEAWIEEPRWSWPFFAQLERRKLRSISLRTNVEDCSEEAKGCGEIRVLEGEVKEDAQLGREGFSFEIIHLGFIHENIGEERKAKTVQNLNILLSCLFYFFLPSKSIYTIKRIKTF